MPLQLSVTTKQSFGQAPLKFDSASSSIGVNTVPVVIIPVLVGPLYGMQLCHACSINCASHLRWQVGEAALAGEHGLEFEQLLVAPMVAALRYELARLSEVSFTSMFRPGASASWGAIAFGGASLIIPSSGANDPVYTTASRARSSAISARVERHWSRLSDLFDLVEIARGTTPIPYAAAEGSPGE